jgi:hypothetical protein
MRRTIVLCALLAAGCGKRAPEAAPPADPLAICQALLRAHQRLLDCAATPEGKAMQAGVLDRLPMLWSWAKTEEELQIAHRGCATQLADLDRAVGAQCDLRLSEAERSSMRAQVERRTAVPPSGDPAIDAFTARVVALRDRMCGCADRACAEAVGAEVDGLDGSVRDAPQAVRDAMGAVIDEITTCQGRMTH